MIKIANVKILPQNKNKLTNQDDLKLYFCRTLVLGLGLGVDFTFAWDNNNNNDKNPHLNFLKGTVLVDK